MNTISKLGLTLGTGALTFGGIAGVATLAQAADPTPAPSASSTATPGGSTSDAPGERGGRHGGGMHGDLAAKLASKLGVDEAKVTEALKTAREANRPAQDAQGTTKPDPAARDAAMASELAKALGIDEAQVTEALDALRAESNAERASALQDKLAQAVTDGTLTQAEADAVKKAVEAGVIGGPGGGGRR